MMSRKPTAIKGAAHAVLWLALMCMGLQAWAAQVAGTVTQLSGPLMVKKPDGKVKVLALKSEVESGDTLVTEKNTYALVKFIDNSEITLKPSTTFVVEQFAFEAGQPALDQASFSLVKGGLRSLSGLLGKRNKEKFALKTPVATIGIRGTYFTVTFIGPPLPTPTVPLAPTRSTAPSAPSLAPGLYVEVIDGEVFVKNGGGTQNFTGGQIGYTPNFVTPPVILPTNPGIPFSAPPSFSSTQGNTSTFDAADKGMVNCIVQ